MKAPKVRTDGSLGQRPTNTIAQGLALKGRGPFPHLVLVRPYRANTPLSGSPRAML
jgi:hypothetical protein